MAFTHGYGVAMPPLSRVKGSGDPDFLVGDLPVLIDPSDEVILDRPQLYVGEGLDGYAVVGASRSAVAYTDEQPNLLLNTSDADHHLHRITLGAHSPKQKAPPT